jgi:hypothetical protein
MPRIAPVLSHEPRPGRTKPPRRREPPARQAAEEPETVAAALSTVVRRATIPFAYTLTVWGSTNVVEARAGSPSTFGVVLYVLGAGLAFALITLVALHIGLRTSVPPPPGLPRVGLFQLTAVGASLGLAIVASRLAAPIVWFVVGALVTAAFVLVSSIDVVIAGLRRR